MSLTTHPAGVPVGTPEIRDVLQTSLREYFGFECRIVNFERRPSPYRTSFAVDEIDVRLGDGQSLPIIFKDLSPHQLLGEARLAPTFLRHPHRELEVYRSLLEPEELGTPACYGTVCSDADQRYWLFLERIPGVQLGQVGDFEAWEEAARWIARLHMRFAHATDGQLGRARATSSLLTHDASFYRRWAARALTYLMQTGSACSEDTVRQFTPLANDYDRVVRRLVSLDRTLIHGEFYASNILVTQFDGAPQVSPVDWEMAAVGPGLVDLAALASGWSEPNRRPLALAYYETLPPTDRGSLDTFLESFDYCQLQVAVQWLGWAQGWTPPADHAQDWLAESVRLAARLRL